MSQKASQIGDAAIMKGNKHTSSFTNALNKYGTNQSPSLTFFKETSKKSNHHHQFGQPIVNAKKAFPNVVKKIYVSSIS